MSSRFTAVFEKGVLRPLTPPNLPEGQQVQVIVLPNGPAPVEKTPVQIMRDIAALPVEGGGDPHTSRDHDRVLYGEKAGK